MRVCLRLRNLPENEAFRQHLAEQEAALNKELRTLSGDNLLIAQGKARFLDELKNLVEGAPAYFHQKPGVATVTPIPRSTTPSNKP